MWKINPAIEKRDSLFTCTNNSLYYYVIYKGKDKYDIYTLGCAVVKQHNNIDLSALIIYQDTLKTLSGIPLCIEISDEIEVKAGNIIKINTKGRTDNMYYLTIQTYDNFIFAAKDGRVLTDTLKSDKSGAVYLSTIQKKLDKVNWQVSLASRSDYFKE